MFEKLEDVEKRFEEVSKKISDPEVIARQSEWQKLMKEHAAMVDVVEKYREYKKANKDLTNEALTKDAIKNAIKNPLSQRIEDSG